MKTIKQACKIKKSKPAHITVLSVFLTAFLFVQVFYFSLFQSGFDFVISKISILSNVISSALIDETNEYRLTQQEENLIVSNVLTQAAQMKAEDMALKGYFSHIGPEGEKPWSWFNKVNYKYQYAGENLAVDFSESEDVVNAWINSTKHNANLLSPNFTEIGIGVADGMFEGHKTIFIVQFFGSPFQEKIIEEVKENIIIPAVNNLADNTTPIRAINEPVDGQPIVENLTNLIAPTVAIITRSDFPNGEVLGSEINSEKNVGPTEADEKASTLILITALSLFLAVFVIKIFSKAKKEIHTFSLDK